MTLSVDIWWAHNNYHLQASFVAIGWFGWPWLCSKHQPFALLFRSEDLFGNSGSFTKEKERIFSSNVPRIIPTICKAKRMSWHAIHFLFGMNFRGHPTDLPAGGVVKICHIYGIFIDPCVLSSTLMVVRTYSLLCSIKIHKMQCNWWEVICSTVQFYEQGGSSHSIDIYMLRVHRLCSLS